MKTLITLLINVVCLLPLPGKAFQLSNEAEISILTCSPGKELYSLFGHTAIRVQDPKANLDEVFNYGTFDFDTPHFYLKFAQGLLPYQLSATSFRNFMLSYQMEERSVYSQPISAAKSTYFNCALKSRTVPPLYHQLQQARPGFIQETSSNAEGGFKCATICVWKIVLKLFPTITTRQGVYHGKVDTGSVLSGTIGSSNSGKRILYAPAVPELST